MRLQNNIVYAVGGEDYIAPSSSTALITGTNNLWFGAGSAPTFLTGSVNADPLFVSTASRDFRLQTASPAIDAGVNTSLSQDYGGVLRAQGLAYDIGAHEFISATVGLSVTAYLPLVTR